MFSRAPTLSIRVRATMRTDPPGGIVPSEQLVLPHVPCVTCSETIVARAAASSVTVTPVAVCGPLLVTTIVHSTISPRVATRALTNFCTARSDVPGSGGCGGVGPGGVGFGGTGGPVRRVFTIVQTTSCPAATSTTSSGPRKLDTTSPRPRFARHAIVVS